MNVPSLLPAAARRPAASPAVRPQLTSLVDMLTILLVFLLKSFSVEGDLMAPAPGLHLPTSSSRDRARPEVSVEVTRTEIRVDGRSVVALADVRHATGAAGAAAGATPDASFAGPIPQLAAALAALEAQDARAAGGSAAADAGGKATARAVTIQCDRDQEFRLLERVMTTCSRAGFSDYSLLVTREGS